MKRKIAIVDDKRQNINSLVEKIHASGECSVIFTALNGAEYIKKLSELPAADHPDAVLMDLDMPVMNGIEAIKKAAGINRKVKYIMLTVFDDDDNLFEAIKAGADGYLLKGESIKKIIEALSEVIDEQGAPMSPAIARKTLKLLSASQKAPNNTSETDNTLSEREQEILKNQVRGMGYKQIAEKMFISPNTVKKHLANIYKKLHITSKAEAIKYSIKNKLT